MLTTLEVPHTPRFLRFIASPTRRCSDWCAVNSPELLLCAPESAIPRIPITTNGGIMTNAHFAVPAGWEHLGSDDAVKSARARPAPATQYGLPMPVGSDVRIDPFCVNRSAPDPSTGSGLLRFALPKQLCACLEYEVVELLTMDSFKHED